MKTSLIYSASLMMVLSLPACDKGNGEGGSSGTDSASGTDSTSASGTDSASSGVTQTASESNSGTTAGTASATGTSTTGATDTSGSTTDGTATGVAETGPGAECGAEVCDPGSQFCDWIMNSCGSVNYDEGACMAKPEGCTEEYEPVCGCDGQVYGNGCEAQAAGTDLNEAGDCTPPDGLFPCGPKFCDASGSYCVMEATDVLPSPNGYSCKQVPNDCGESPSCDCIGDPCLEFGGTCEQDENGNITVTCPGG